ncbi:MAG: HNH endonuclease [Candidatus Nealsonbacteria bacterium]|nr:MAG: HNH endonuclease [Candidatus Nealsonbacteria bacterium]
MVRYKNASEYRRIIGIRTIRDIIFYQYAKIITKSAFKVQDGRKAKKKHFGFIKKTFLEFKNGSKSWSDITREDWQFVEAKKECIYCGTKNNLHKEHIVPKSLLIKQECKTCSTIQSIHNQIWACRQCNSVKGTKGLYEFFKLKYSNKKKFYDFIPLLLEKKYLKTIYNCHKCAKTLEKEDLDGDGKITVLDIDFIIHRSV